MVFVGFLTWWYRSGFGLAIRRIRDWLASTYDYFSIDVLLGSLFAPFRQISAGRVDGPVGIKMRAFFDRLFSRLIGAFVRSLVILVGLLGLLATVIIGTIYVILWTVLPLLPIIFIVLFMIGYLPWTI